MNNDAMVVVTLNAHRPTRRVQLPCCRARWRQYVDGAIGGPAQIGSTPDLVRVEGQRAGIRHSGGVTFWWSTGGVRVRRRELRTA
ncbi:MAG: hypothetical protein ABIS06_15485 [Vicinamibacterales bacterium]